MLFLSWCPPRRSGEAVELFPDVCKRWIMTAKQTKGLLWISLGLSQQETDQKSFLTKGSGMEPTCLQLPTGQLRWAGRPRTSRALITARRQVDKLPLERDGQKRLQGRPKDGFKSWETAWSLPAYRPRICRGVGDGLLKKSGDLVVPNQRKWGGVLGGGEILKTLLQ